MAKTGFVLVHEHNIPGGSPGIIGGIVSFSETITEAKEELKKLDNNRSRIDGYELYHWIEKCGRNKR